MRRHHLCRAPRQAPRRRQREQLLQQQPDRLRRRLHRRDARVQRRPDDHQRRLDHQRHLGRLRDPLLVFREEQQVHVHLELRGAGPCGGRPGGCVALEIYEIDDWAVCALGKKRLDWKEWRSGFVYIARLDNRRSWIVISQRRVWFLFLLGFNLRSFIDRLTILCHWQRNLPRCRTEKNINDTIVNKCPCFPLRLTQTPSSWQTSRSCAVRIWNWCELLNQLKNSRIAMMQRLPSVIRLESAQMADRHI